MACAIAKDVGEMVSVHSSLGNYLFSRYDPVGNSRVSSNETHSTAYTLGDDNGGSSWDFAIRSEISLSTLFSLSKSHGAGDELTKGVRTLFEEQFHAMLTIIITLSHTVVAFPVCVGCVWWVRAG